MQHWLGAEGMPRRYADDLPTDGFTTLNTISSIGAFVLGVSTLPFLWNVFRSYRYGRVVTVDDPWGFGKALEWATSCPPPRHNFTELPRSTPNATAAGRAPDADAPRRRRRPTPRARPAAPSGLVLGFDSGRRPAANAGWRCDGGGARRRVVVLLLCGGRAGAVAVQ